MKLLLWAQLLAVETIEIKETFSSSWICKCGRACVNELLVALSIMMIFAVNVLYMWNAEEVSLYWTFISKRLFRLCADRLSNPRNSLYVRPNIIFHLGVWRVSVCVCNVSVCDFWQRKCWWVWVCVVHSVSIDRLSDSSFCSADRQWWRAALTPDQRVHDTLTHCPALTESIDPIRMDGRRQRRTRTAASEPFLHR